MVIMVGVVGVFFVFYYNNLDIENVDYCEIIVICLIVKVFILVVWSYKYIVG